MLTSYLFLLVKYTFRNMFWKKICLEKRESSHWKAIREKNIFWNLLLQSIEKVSVWKYVKNCWRWTISQVICSTLNALLQVSFSIKASAFLELLWYHHRKSLFLNFYHPWKFYLFDKNESGFCFTSRYNFFQ